MSKIVLDEITSGYQLSKVNENFQKIEDELNNRVLYRNAPDGEINTVEKDIDLNGKKLYNVGDIQFQGFDSLEDLLERTTTAAEESEASKDAAEVAAENAAISAASASTYSGSAVVRTFSGDGSTVAFNLTASPLTKENTQVYIGSVYQRKSTYSVTDNILTFNTAPPVGTNNIEVVIFESVFVPQSGYTIPVTYSSDIVLSQYNQLVEYNSEFYKLKAGQAPYTTTGTWETDSAKLVAVGDAALRQELAAGDGASKVGYQVSGGVVRDVAGKLGEFVSVKDFGAVGDGVTDDTASIQDAVTYCAVSGRALYIPAGTYKMTSPITSNVMVTIIGEGRNKSTLLWGGAAATAVLYFQLTGGNTFFNMLGVSVTTATIGYPTSMMKIELSSPSAYCSNFEIEGCYFGPSSSYSLSLDNSIANANGFFTFTIRRNFIHCGINGIKIGDSCNIQENTITIGSPSPAVGLTTLGVLVTGLGGARQVVIRENNITTAGGAIALIGVEQPRVENNQCEHPFYYGIDYGGPYAAAIYVGNSPFSLIKGNTVQTGASVVTGADYSILFEGNASFDGKIEDNDIFKGEFAHVGFAGACYRNTLGQNTYQGGAKSLYVDNPSVYPQIGVELPLTLLNGWVSDTSAGDPTPFVIYTEDGIGHLFGVVKDGAGVIANLHSSITTKQSRCITAFGASTSDHSVLQISSGTSAAIAPVSTPGNPCGLTGAVFRYEST